MLFGDIEAFGKYINTSLNTMMKGLQSFKKHTYSSKLIENFSKKIKRSEYGISTINIDKKMVMYEIRNCNTAGKQVNCFLNCFSIFCLRDKMTIITHHTKNKVLF